VETKTDATLEILTSLNEGEIAGFETLLGEIGVENNTFSVVVKYNGDIERVAEQENIKVEILGVGYAAMRVTTASLKKVMTYPEIVYMETPKRYTYNLQQSSKASCVPNVQSSPSYQLKGKGTLLAIIDSGIVYSHPDFRNEDGSTRIVAIWDQTLTGTPPIGFHSGAEYTQEQINKALAAPTKSEQLQIVPSTDTNGHGTHVAGIAGGNGRASRNDVVGMAPEASFVIVKVGSASNEELIQTINIMLAVRYVLEKAKALNMPVAINISIGTNIGSHDGRSLIEQFLNEMALTWKSNIVVGTGNEGNAQNHARRVLAATGRQVIFEIQIAQFKANYRSFVWQSFIDEVSFQIISPNGERTPKITYAQGPREYVLGSTKIYVTFAGPSPLNGDIEFAVFFMGISKSYITSGVWQIVAIGEQIIDGRLDMWGDNLKESGGESYLLQATPETTLTTPSSAGGVISVGAYNSITNQLAPFSGRGYARATHLVKPDLVAPGVDILAASYTGGYQTLSGTSMATPHVTGAAALLMEWGIVKQHNTYLYGENLKTYLLRGTHKDIPESEIPNPLWGYGKLCVKDSLDQLIRQQIF
jgi:subtilisin family serine protease